MSAQRDLVDELFQIVDVERLRLVLEVASDVVDWSQAKEAFPAGVGETSQGY